MRVCQRGWEHAQIYGKDGDVSICAWAAINYMGSVGKLSDKTIEEIWHGKEITEFRNSLVDGSYRYCEKEKCPWIANGTLEEHMKEYDDVLPYPTEVALAYERNCNYNCTCCGDRNNEEAHECDAEKKREKIEKELGKFINDATTISANGRGELFVSPHILKMLHDWKPNAPEEEIKVLLETNGSLFDEEHWKLIENLGKYDLKVVITVMGFDEATYQFLSGCKYPVSKLENNLRFVKSLREKGIINDFEIGTVIQERNFREMPELTRRCIEEFGADRVRHRPYFPWGPYDEGAKWFFDIRNPHHPYYPEYKKVFSDPIFKHPKVLMWAGDELSKQGKNPYQKDKDNYDVIKWFAVDPTIGNKIVNYVHKKEKNNVSIYGWGFTGKALMLALENSDIEIDYIIDRARVGECRNNNIVISKSEIPKDYNGLILVSTPYYYEEIFNDLVSLNLEKNIINIAEIIKDIQQN